MIETQKYASNDDFDAATGTTVLREAPVAGQGVKTQGKSDIAQRTAILVLGMRRSGTSALTRVISLLGADLPSNLMPSAIDDNEASFWESVDAYRLNDEILASAGSRRDDWRRFNPDWIRSAASKRFKERALELLQQDFAKSSLFAFNDPSVCRLLPFWLEVLREFDTERKCVLPIRNPLEVGASLEKRDGFSPAKSYMLWLRHVLDAEYVSRGLTRAFVTYHELLDDWRTAATALSDELAIAWPSRSATAEVEIDRFLLHGHRHHAIGDDLAFSHPEVSSWVKETYAALNTLRAEPESEDALSRLDTVRLELNRASDSFGVVLRSEEVAREEQEQLAKQREVQITALEQNAAEREERIAKLERTATERGGRMGDLERRAAEREARIAELEQELASEKQQRIEVLGLKNQLLHRLSGIQTTASWQLARPLFAAESRWPRLVRSMAALPRLAWWTLTLRLPERLRLRRQAIELLEKGLFDLPWYVEQNPDLVLHGANPVMHWLVAGWKEGRDPSANFNTSAALMNHSDAAKAGRNPLVDDLTSGNEQNRSSTAPAVVSTSQENDSKPSSQPWHQPLGESSLRSLGQRVLIIAELSIPQCKKYRVDQKIEMLRLLGYEVSALSWRDDEQCHKALQTHGMVIFYRVPVSPQVWKFLEETRRLGLVSFFDIDDLVFDPDDYARNSNLLSLPAAQQELLLDGSRRYRKALSLTDHAIASTEVLAEKMRALCRGSVFVLENALDSHLLALAAESAPQPNCDEIVIGYGSGTNTHDADFAVAAEALSNLLDRYPQVRLAIYGHLRIPPVIERHEDRINRVPMLNPDDYYRSLRRFDISIAPLENTVFNNAKSNIKFLEASLFKVPSVCSPSEAFRQAIRHGENGMLAGSTREWLESLSQLVQDGTLRQRIAETANRDVLERYHPTAIAATQFQPILDVGLRVKATAPPPDSKRRLRVLLVNVLFAPTSFGGATIVVEELACGLNARPDTEVTVFTGNFSGDLPRGTATRYEWKGLPVFVVRLPTGGVRELDYENPTVGTMFADVLKAVRPDVVHFHSIQMLSASLARECAIFDVPYLITLHDAWWLCERQFMVKESGAYCNQPGVDPRRCLGCVADPAYTHRRFHWLWQILDSAALLLAPSQSHRDLYVKTGVSPERIAVNRNGVRQPSSGYRKHRRDGPLVLAFLGGRAVHKGYYWLQEILSGIAEPDYILRIVDLERKITGNPGSMEGWAIAGRVQFVPPFAPDGLDDFYQDMDVLLFPSLWKESFGLTVREAMLRDVWVVATECGGPVEEIVAGENGDLVPMGDTDAFRAAVRDVIREPSRIRAYRNPLKSTVRLVDEQVEELSALLRSVVEERTNAIRPHKKNMGTRERGAA